MVLAQGLPGRCTLCPIALLTSSSTLFACSRDDASGQGTGQAGTVGRIPYALTCVCHRHQHNSAKHEHITTRSGVDQNQKGNFSSSPFCDGGYPSDRIAGKGLGLGFYGAAKGMGYFSSILESYAWSAQQRYSNYQYALHVTVLLMLPSTEISYRSWLDILTMICQTSRLDTLSVYLAIYGPLNRRIELEQFVNLRALMVT